MSEMIKDIMYVLLVLAVLPLAVVLFYCKMANAKADEILGYL